MRTTMLAALAAACLALAACGDDEDFANEPRPPNPIVVTAVVADERVSVSPSRFGAGIIVLRVTNQAPSSQRVTLRSRAGGRAIEQTTGPINPNDVAELRADVRPGTYTVSSSSDAVEPATVTVGPPRPSAQDQLLQP